MSEFSNEDLKLSFNQRGAICLANLIIFLFVLITNFKKKALDYFLKGFRIDQGERKFPTI